jgi:hypothetical protein
MILKKAGVALAATLIAVGGGIVSASSAHADTRTCSGGNNYLTESGWCLDPMGCTRYYYCMFYMQSGSGAMWQEAGGMSDLSGFTFDSANILEDSRGHDQAVENNSESVFDGDPSCWLYVWAGLDWTGAYHAYHPASGGNLNVSVKDQDKSTQWVC